MPRPVERVALNALETCAWQPSGLRTTRSTPKPPQSFANRARACSCRPVPLTKAELSRLRYDKGLINYFEVNDGERSLLQAERSQSQLLAARFAASVKLLQALGGGWKLPAPAPSPAAK